MLFQGRLWTNFFAAVSLHRLANELRGGSILLSSESLKVSVNRLTYIDGNSFHTYVVMYVCTDMSMEGKPLVAVVTGRKSFNFAKVSTYAKASADMTSDSSRRGTAGEKV